MRKVCNQGNESIWKPRGRWEDILKYILKKQGGIAWTGLITMRKGISVNMAKKLSGS